MYFFLYKNSREMLDCISNRNSVRMFEPIWKDTENNIRVEKTVFYTVDVYIYLQYTKRVFTIKQWRHLHLHLHVQAYLDYLWIYIYLYKLCSYTIVSHFICLLFLNTEQKFNYACVVRHYMHKIKKKERIFFFGGEYWHSIATDRMVSYDFCSMQMLLFHSHHRHSMLILDSKFPTNIHQTIFNTKLFYRKKCECFCSVNNSIG